MAYTTINKPTDYFNTKLYTGNGNAGNAITGVGFKPDWTWIKDRGNTRNHVITDAVRGVTKVIVSNSADAEGTDTSTLTAFGTDGFTLGNGTKVNGNGINFASWNWLAGNSAGSANTAGSINSTVSVNTTAGFSIVKYTGNATVSTIGHGLGAAPKIIITKNLSRSDAWPVDARIGTGGIYYLNQTDGTGSYGDTSPYPSTAPTNLVYSVGTAGNTNYSGSTLIAYCFAEKQGYSKFGSYTATNNADGPLVYTGFKPAWVLFKRSSAVENWSLYDSKRLAYNPKSLGLRPNSNLAESTYGAGGSAGAVDFLNFGFKIRESGTNINNGTYIYMAFAEAPLVGTNNVPATAG